jgi:hypothetical protein
MYVFVNSRSFFSFEGGCVASRSQLEAAKKKPGSADGDQGDDGPQVLSDHVGKSGKRQIVRAPRAVRPLYVGNKPMNRFNIPPGVFHLSTSSPFQYVVWSASFVSRMSIVFSLRFTGYRWDGVDRSNGWEKQLFLKMNERHAQSNDAYAWSVEDM